MPRSFEPGTTCNGHFFMPKNTPKTLTYNGDWQVVISNRILRDSSLSLEARFLYLTIKSFVGPHCASPFPSLDTLSRIMGRHREGVQKYLKELETAGLLRRSHVKKRGQFTATRYTLFEKKSARQSDRVNTEKNRSGKKPLRSPQRLFPTTEKAATKTSHIKVIPSVLGDTPAEHTPADAPPQTNKVLIPFANPLAQAHEVNPCANGHATESLQRGESEGELRKADGRRAG